MNNEKPEKKCNVFKAIFKVLISLIITAVVAVVAVGAFAYFKYNVNAITLVKTIDKLDDFDENSLVLENAFIEADYTSAKTKLEGATFVDNKLNFSAKEVGALCANNLAVNNTSGYAFNLLELNFVDPDSADAFARLNFCIKLNTQGIKNKLSKFPASILADKLEDSLIIHASADIVSVNSTYAVRYIDLTINNITQAETDNLFRLLALISKDFKIETFGEALAKPIADTIIGESGGIFDTLKTSGAKSYLFNKSGGLFNFSVFTYTFDEERTISYTDEHSVPHTNPTTYKLTSGIITLQPLSKTGYNFKGWFDSSNNKVTTIDCSKMNNYTLTAKWETIEYQITYNLNGGTVSGVNPTTYTIETHTFNLINPTKNEGADPFVGWTGTGISNNTLTVTITQGTTGNLTFTAHFQYDMVVVTFNVDGEDVYSQEFTNGTTFTSALANTTYQCEEAGMVGYQVANWYDDSTRTTPFTFGQPLTNDLTIYGQSNYFVSSPLTPAQLTKFNNALGSSLHIENDDELKSFVFFTTFFNIGDTQAPNLYLDYLAKNATIILEKLGQAFTAANNASCFQSGTSIMRSSNGDYGKIYVQSSSFEDFATQTLDSTGSLYQPVYSAPLLTFADTRGEDFNNFNINKVQNSITVTKSEQLVFALEMGFNPVCAPGSPAESVYNSAKAILKDICNDNMSNVDKVYAIYTWLVNNVKYDHYAADESEAGRIDGNESREYDSWFAEGVFNNRKAVCEGYAKAFLIMAKLENIPCIYVTGNNHAWNKVYVNGDWFAIDATHGDLGVSGSSNKEVLSFTTFLFPDSFRGVTSTNVFVTNNHPEIVANTTFDFYDGYLNLTNGSQYFDLYIDSVTEFSRLANYIKPQLPASCTEFTLEVVLAPSVSVSSLGSYFTGYSLDQWTPARDTALTGQSARILFFELVAQKIKIYLSIIKNLLIQKSTN